MRGLITDLVSGLFDQEQIQQVARAVRARPAMRERRRGLMIRGQEGFARALSESLDDAALAYLCRLILPGPADIDDGRRGIVERAHHARDIPLRTAERAPLTDGARRLAFEIDEKYITLRHQRLPEVQITVDAHRQRAASRLCQSVGESQRMRARRLQQLDAVALVG